MTTEQNQNQKLNDAVNLIAGHCFEQMPKGWCLSIHFAADEVSSCLMDPEGNEHDDYQYGEDGMVAEACEYAANYHAEMAEDARLEGA